jgi:hypothetical protein
VSIYGDKRILFDSAARPIDIEYCNGDYFMSKEVIRVLFVVLRVAASVLVLLVRDSSHSAFGTRGMLTLSI